MTFTIKKGQSSAIVTGIAGAIGETVAFSLIQSGFSVIGYDLSAPPTAVVEILEKQHKGDIADRNKLEMACSEADAVVHLAGWVHAVPGSEEERRKVFEINHDATREISSLCKRKDKKLVFASTVAVYGDTASGRLTEYAPTAPSTAYAESKLLAEKHVLDAGGTVLRFPMVYGARDRGNMAKMIRAIMKGRFVVPWHGSAMRTFVGRWNAAEAIRCALENDEARGKIYLVTDDEDIRLGELCDKIADIAGCRRPPRVPSSIVAAAALAGSCLGRVTKRKMPVDWPSYRKLVRDLSFDGSLIRKELGYRPIKTLEQGLEEEIDWLRSIDA